MYNVLCLCLVGILFIVCSNFHWRSFKVTTVVLKVYILYHHLRYKIYCTDFSTCCTSLLHTKKGYLACLASPKAAFKFASSGLRSVFFIHVVCSFYLFILDCDLLVSFSCFLVISLQTLLTPQYCKLVAIIFVRDQRYKCQDSARAYVPVVCR